MGFFDLFAAKKQQRAAANPTGTSPVEPSAAAPAPEATPTGAPSASAPAANLKAKLLQARERLDAKDLPGARALYDELLAVAGDRPDVLVAISGDLGATGNIDTIIELIAPCYDAERHGPATGLNLLQAYLVTRQPEPAQHLLDILFALQRPELEQRLYGFSNALAELIAGLRRGDIPPPGAPEVPNQNGVPAEPSVPKTVSLASISKPIWAYGVEEVAGVLPPAKTGKVRRIAFAQLALLDPAENKVARADNDTTRFARGFALWMAETFYFTPHYAPIAALGIIGKDSLASFPSEWTAANLRQLVSSATEGLDYIITGALKKQDDVSEILLRVWEVKKMKERKTFTARWTGTDANAALNSLHEQVRLFMEWQNHPAGPEYVPPADPVGWCDSLGLSLTLFLADKNVLPADQVPTPSETGARLAVRASQSERDALTWYTAVDRARRLALLGQFPGAASPYSSPVVEAARHTLGL